MARPHRLLSQSANLISASRFILAGMWVAVFFGERSHPGILRAIALGGATSDFLDGRIARLTHSAGRFGRWLDNVADIVFVLSVLACETRAKAVPIYLPALVAVSFAQYVADSIWIRGSAVPIKSRLGHWAGIFNYIIVIALSWAPPTRLPGVLVKDFAPLIAVYYLAAMGERVTSYRRLCGLRRVAAIKPVAGE